MLHLTLRPHKIYYIARNRQVANFNSCILKMCTVEYNLSPTYLLFAIHIRAGKQTFHNFYKNSDLFFGTWADNVSKNNTTDCSQCPNITKPSGVSVFNGPFAKCLCPTHIHYWQKKNICCYFRPLPYFYILCEIMLVINIESIELIRNFEAISN